MTPAVPGLTPLEIACGLVFGLAADDPLARVDTVREPRQAFEDAVLRALQRPPCVVSFSGGRDSSAVLAVATHLARREGLDLPVPATNRFGEVETANEDEFQEQVIRHLGLTEWARLEHTDELDCVGPVSTATLRRHGLLWPFNTFFHAPFLSLAGGGTLLTGIGGDEILMESTWRRVRLSVSRRRRLSRRDAQVLAYVTAPPALRRLALLRRKTLYFPWLRPHAAESVHEAYARQLASEPRRWEAYPRWVHRMRYLRVGRESLRRIAEEEEVSVVSPFLAPEFAAALARLPRSSRYSSRTHAMQLLFGDLLPETLLTRTTKAGFDAAFWNEPSRAFARGWDGSGADPELVDAEALRTEWLSDSPDPRSFLLAQALWLELDQRSAAALGEPVERFG